MRITAFGFLTDHKSHVLLQQTAARVLSPVGCSLESGRPPEASLARAFRAATGLIVMPVRIVGLYHSEDDAGSLTLTYRCTLRGGQLTVPPGMPPAGFFGVTPLPRGLGAADRRMLADALGHAGGPPVLASTSRGWTARLGRRAARVIGGVRDDWEVSARLLAVDGDRVAWARAEPGAAWGLPGVSVAPGQAPWLALRRWRRALAAPDSPPALRLIHQAAARPALTFVFAVDGRSGAATEDENILWATPDDAVQNAADVALARAALTAGPVVSLVGP